MTAYDETQIKQETEDAPARGPGYKIVKRTEYIEIVDSDEEEAPPSASEMSYCIAYMGRLMTNEQQNNPTVTDPRIKEEDS